MDEAQQKEYVAAHMDSDLQFVLSDSGVSLEGQVAIARRYGNMTREQGRDSCSGFSLGGCPGIHLEGGGDSCRGKGSWPATGLAGPREAGNVESSGVGLWAITRGRSPFC